MNLNVLVPNHEGSDVRESAMGGKHQRSLSLSARWASDKAMAIEYLRRQREVMTWIQSVLKRELPTTDLFEALRSGVVLREMMETLFPDVSNCMSPISRNYSKRMAPWKERENISVFLRQCKSIGMYDLSLFCTDDLYEGTNMVQVLFCVQHFMMFSEEHAGHLFKPVAKNEPAEFSNQELEMAMSKIEQAGVDAKALKGLISATSSSIVLEKTDAREKENKVRAASEPISSPLKEEKLESVKDQEPTGSKEYTEEETKVKMQLEVCNQVSDDKQDVENPADDDDLNPAQESGSDGDDDDEAAHEDNSVIEQEASVAEELPVDSSMVEGVETMIVVQQVLSNMTTVIEEAEAEVQLVTTQDIPSVPDTLTVAMEATVKSVDQTNVEIVVTDQSKTLAVDSTDAPTPAEEVEPSVETTQKTRERKEDTKPQETEDEELEAKAMAKCTCGRCSIM